MAVGARNDYARTDLRGDSLELRRRVAAFGGYPLAGNNAVARQPHDKVFYSRRH